MHSNPTAGVILAGGKASRMKFQDKPLLRYLGKPLIEHVIRNAAPQVEQLIISVNRNIDDFTYLDIPLVPDNGDAFAGPLVGIYSTMKWLQAHCSQDGYTHLACFAGDVPCFPRSLVSTLHQALVDANCQLAVARSGTQIQPLFSLWSLETAPVLAHAISENLYGPKLVLPRIDHIVVPVDSLSTVDFYNINTPEDLTQLNKLVP